LNDVFSTSFWHKLSGSVDLKVIDDDINRAMPFNAPQSLAPDEVYSVIAWLLLQNQVIADDVIIDAQTLPKVQMPNRNGLKEDFISVGEPTEWVEGDTLGLRPIRALPLWSLETKPFGDGAYAADPSFTMDSPEPQPLGSRVHMTRPIHTLSAIMLIVASATLASGATSPSLEQKIRERTASIETKLIAWRRDIHQHPELGDQELRTSRLVEEHLRRLGLEVTTGVARTGVVGILKGAQPGRTLALRADMDALPIKEPEVLPFASKVKGRHWGKEVDVMHACGHDAHTAMLMATAEVLVELKNAFAGTILFIFQPAEEGSSLFEPSSGKTWGAQLMLQEGLFAETKPDAVFGLHVMPGRLGEISYRSGATTASSDGLDITITGKQGHGGMPWNTIDPITTSALVISGLQTVVSRQANLTISPAVITIGTIHGGLANNVVPETVHMSGTIRTYDKGVRELVRHQTRVVAEKIAESAGAKADVSIVEMYDTTINDERLTGQMQSVLERAADGKVSRASLVGASEDFSFYAKATPGLFVFLGVTPPDQDPATAAPNHNPAFFVDESALVVGTRTMASLAVNFLGLPADK
jgi:amidohydrolase